MGMYGVGLAEMIQQYIPQLLGVQQQAPIMPQPQPQPAPPPQVQAPMDLSHLYPPAQGYDEQYGSQGSFPGMGDQYINPAGVQTGGQYIQSQMPQQASLPMPFPPPPDPYMGADPGLVPMDSAVDHSQAGNFNRAFGDDTVRMEEAIRRDQKQNILQSLYAAAGANPGDIAGMLGAAAPGMAGAMNDFPIEEMRRARQQERLDTLGKIKSLNAPTGGYRSPQQRMQDRVVLENPKQAYAATEDQMFGKTANFGLPVGEVKVVTGPDGEERYKWAGAELTRAEMMEVVRGEKLKAKGDTAVAESRVETAGKEATTQEIMRVMKIGREAASRLQAAGVFSHISAEASEQDIRAAYELFGEQGGDDVMAQGTAEEYARYQEAQSRGDKDVMALIVLEVKKRTGG